MANMADAEQEIIERLAALSHEQWAGWAKWMLQKMGDVHDSGEAFVDRWERQIQTPYAELSEAEKESDRIEARKMLPLIADVFEHDLKQAIEAMGAATAKVNQMKEQEAELRAHLKQMIDAFTWAGKLFDSRLTYLYVHSHGMTEEEKAQAAEARAHRDAALALLAKPVE